MPGTIQRRDLRTSWRRLDPLLGDPSQKHMRFEDPHAEGSSDPARDCLPAIRPEARRDLGTYVRVPLLAGVSVCTPPASHPHFFGLTESHPV